MWVLVLTHIHVVVMSSVWRAKEPTHHGSYVALHFRPKQSPRCSPLPPVDRTHVAGRDELDESEADGGLGRLGLVEVRGHQRLFFQGPG